MQNLYCISGLGADDKVFRYLDLSFANIFHIKWINPKPDESLQAYATRLKEKFIPEERPLILGLSLGGMLATEIAKQLPKAKVVIISSAKTKYELPFYWRMFKRVPVYKILPFWIIQQTAALQEYFLGAKSASNKQYVRAEVKPEHLHFYKWALGAILTWPNKIIPSNVTHLHGSKDRLLPLQFVKADFIIKNGSHSMIIENASENSALLKKIFTEKIKTDELNLAL